MTGNRSFTPARKAEKGLIELVEANVRVLGAKWQAGRERP